MGKQIELALIEDRKIELEGDLKNIQDKILSSDQQLSRLRVDEHRVIGALALIAEIEGGMGTTPEEPKKKAAAN